MLICTQPSDIPQPAMRDGSGHDLQHKLVHLTPVNPYLQRQDELRNVVWECVDKIWTLEVHMKPTMLLNEKTLVRRWTGVLWTYLCIQYARGFQSRSWGSPCTADLVFSLLNNAHFKLMQGSVMS